MDDIYSDKIMALAADSAFEGRLASPDVTVTKTSRICGSRITVDVCFDNGCITKFGQETRACVMAQACANIVALRVIGLNKTELLSVADAFEAMVKEGLEPHWPDEKWKALEIFKSLHGNRIRYASVMLIFECMREVYSM